MKRTARIFLSAITCIMLALFSCANENENEKENENLSAEPEYEIFTETEAEPEPVILRVTEGSRISPGADFDFDDPPAPQFIEASVHDPSVFRAGDTFYVIGSHMASAKTTDFIRWEQVSAYPRRGNRLTPDPANDFSEAFEWARTTTFWAGDVEPMPDGRFFMYYCVCEGSMPLGAIGLAIADEPEGPYINQGLFLKSGMRGISPSGRIYDATIDPNAIDPHVFFDNDGQFWMVYGSYSGGIYILKMNPETGLPLEDQGYGTKLLGGNHSRIEGPYIIYSPETGYYYMFLTWGGLSADGGYNMRVMRSKNPDGPYYDAAGKAMINCMGPRGSFFDDRAIEPYGTKIMGGYRFREEPGEPGITTGYLSPGHNSVYYNAETGRYYLIFHTRFVNRGEQHEIRVHEMFLNQNGWFVVSPFRYDGSENNLIFTPGQVEGTYKIIDHGSDINTRARLSELANLNSDGSITGGVSGEWSLLPDGQTIKINADGKNYSGHVLRSYDSDNRMWVMSFTVLSEDGVALWGAGLALR